MSVNKIFETFDKAVADITNGATILIGNFAGPGGTPYYLIQALKNQGAKDLTIVANTAGGTGLTFPVAETLITPLSADIYINSTSTNYFVFFNVVGGEFSMVLRALGSTSAVDMAAAVDAGDIYIAIAYLTDA